MKRKRSRFAGKKTGLILSAVFLGAVFLLVSNPGLIGRLNLLGDAGITSEVSVTFQYGRPVSELGIASYTGAKDVGISAQSPNAGYYQQGKADQLTYRGTRMGLYWFDLSDIPDDAVIKDARLVLYSIPGTNKFDTAAKVPIQFVKTLPPNDSVQWDEGSGLGYYDQYKGTSWLKKDNADGSPRFAWSSNGGRYASGDIASAFAASPAGYMNFTTASGPQTSDNIAATVQKIILDYDYQYEGFVVDKGTMGDTGRKDGIATREYSDPNLRPALKVVYSIPGNSLPPLSPPTPVVVDDSIPPAVYITTPQPGATITGLIVFTGTASDNVGLDRVEIQIDGRLPASTIGTTSWNYIFDPSLLVDGNHTVKVKAVDTSGNVKSVTVNFITLTHVDPPLAGSFLIEKVEGVPQVNTTKRIILPTTSPRPAKCAPFIDPVTGYKITRISDVNDYPELGQKIDGIPGKGFTNGYSRFANTNIDGKYSLAYGSNAHVVLYRLSDCAFLRPLDYINSQGNRTIITESRNPRWDTSGRPGTETTILYTHGTGLYKQDVLIGKSSEVKLYDFINFQGGANVAIESIDHSDQSARYRAVHLKATNWVTPRWVVYDIFEDQLLPGAVTSIDEGDVSPLGNWVYSNKKYYRISDLARGITEPAASTPTPSHGHDGWSFDKAGQEVHVFQDNPGDRFSAFNPATGVRTDIITMAETGWKVNQHMGRIALPINKGWLFMSTYACDNSSWAGNQFLMFEIAQSVVKPRIWRLGSTQNTPFAYCGAVKDYLPEAFANMDYDGRFINWGGNWQRTDNLELYRMELPANWAAQLN